LSPVLHDGPARGVHIFGWWRELGAFAKHTGAVGVAGQLPIAGMALLNVPSTELQTVLGIDLDWQWRPHRAMLYDRDTGRGELIVPFESQLPTS
jgi:hypothetical protein